MGGLTNQARERKRIVISGAGPAGLLTASLLLNKNKEAGCTVTYDVTLIDGRQDYGSIPQKELSENHRSWMLGLADHGMDAIKTLPNLYENYVKDEGILLREFTLYLGSKKITQSIGSSPSSSKLSSGLPEAFIVDRNFVVAAMARYLRETHTEDDNYTSMYKTTCQYVDYENKRVLVRNVESSVECYILYDLLIGCDGVRSTVREALVKRIALPETGGLVNIGIGTARNNFDKLPDELKSDDYKVVSEYVKKNLKAFKLVDTDDFAKQWVGQRWNQTGMIHCNFYHSTQLGIVIMGDAAHATSPSIGMGMNTALRDAAIFSEILKETNDDFSAALPAFSKTRVKEGNALSDLALHLYCTDATQQMKATIHQVIRNFFYTRFPSFVDEHPFTMIGRRGVSLSDAYEQAVKQGIMRKHRAINDRIRMEYFEQETCMIKTPIQKSYTMSKKLFGGASLIAVAAFVYQKVSMK
ncbi:FAD/NAD(P)-binding domain-containing protein [Fragilariopsis cylindrus CCMP1102]|uniref:FAD/NAD(P)-binding domain-containing protein n=1 Tax=Fragilariopsis cylindrus CCMP1102 TaxID=635003 RepID=A0A1E7EVN2_9STRA|nr:FAD/NAD(P)-binding domain-containing protein [Fragilariopsis cylindrus CCMP1102]|eukprot:OEU09926.1 FAD/NAD(P)-binding domain-containing protein [Fragilariopsis cylindrus CCMP1102]